MSGKFEDTVRVQRLKLDSGEHQWRQMQAEKDEALLEEMDELRQMINDDRIKHARTASAKTVADHGTKLAVMAAKFASMRVEIRALAAAAAILFGILFKKVFLP